jgi:hypothetical protein
MKSILLPLVFFTFSAFAESFYLPAKNIRVDPSYHVKVKGQWTKMDRIYFLYNGKEFEGWKQAPDNPEEMSQIMTELYEAIQYDWLVKVDVESGKLVGLSIVKRTATELARETILHHAILLNLTGLKSNFRVTINDSVRGWEERFMLDTAGSKYRGKHRLTERK